MAALGGRRSRGTAGGWCTVEQGLGRVLVGAVAGVDHDQLDPVLGQSPAGPRGAEWRMTMASTPMASRVMAVSLRLSPFETLDPLAEKLITSADRRLRAPASKRDPGPGRVLEEQAADSAATQGRAPS